MRMGEDGSADVERDREEVRAAPPGNHVRLWDLPIRIVHWSFVLLIPASWATYKMGEMWWHMRLGYLMIAILLFRLLWGLVGSSTARFTSFVKGPRAIAAYLRGERDAPAIGHNPLGALSVLLLLALLILQVSLGLFSQDTDGIEAGPLSFHVAYETADSAREWHELVFNLILAAIALHVAAILYYLLAKRENLVGPMVTGRKTVPAGVEAPVMASPWKALICAAVALAITWWISLGAPLGG